MLERCRTAKERWGGVSEIIDHWLEERQSLISEFVSIPGLSVKEELNAGVERFCQLLVDYLSSGHFEVYEQLLREGSEFSDGSLENAQDLFPLIQISTNLALDFNDNYSGFSDPTVQELREFIDALSALGVALEERFELEDKMICILHTAHRDQVMTAEE